jgi:hypothetical protein
MDKYDRIVRDHLLERYYDLTGGFWGNTGFPLIRFILKWSVIAFICSTIFKMVNT